MHENKIPLVYQSMSSHCDWIKILNVLLAYSVMENFGRKTLNNLQGILCYIIYCWNSQTLMKEL